MDLLRPRLKRCLTALISSSVRRFSEPPSGVIKSSLALRSAPGQPAALGCHSGRAPDPASHLHPCGGQDAAPGRLQAAPEEPEAELAVMKLQTHPNGIIAPKCDESRLCDEKVNYLLFRALQATTSSRRRVDCRLAEDSVRLWRSWPRGWPTCQRPITLGSGVRARAGQSYRTGDYHSGRVVFEKLTLGSGDVNRLEASRRSRFTC